MSVCFAYVAAQLDVRGTKYMVFGCAHKSIVTIQRFLEFTRHTLKDDVCIIINPHNRGFIFVAQFMLKFFNSLSISRCALTLHVFNIWPTRFNFKFELGTPK